MSWWEGRDGRLVTIPAGKFKIGTPEPADGSYLLSAEPQPEVTITRPCLMKTSEVAEGECYFVKKKMPKRCKAGPLERLVTEVSWLQAVAYPNELSTLEKLEPCYVIGNDTVDRRVRDERHLEYLVAEGNAGPRTRERRATQLLVSGTVSGPVRALAARPDVGRGGLSRSRFRG